METILKGLRLRWIIPIKSQSPCSDDEQEFALDFHKDKWDGGKEKWLKKCNTMI